MAAALVVLLLILGPGVHTVPTPGFSAGCEPGNHLPPDCTVGVEQGLGSVSAIRVVGGVRTGGYVLYCVAVQNPQNQEQVEFGGGAALSPPRAHFWGACPGAL